MRFFKWLASLFKPAGDPNTTDVHFEFTKAGESYDCVGYIYYGKQHASAEQIITESVDQCIREASTRIGIELAEEIEVEEEAGDYFYGYWSGTMVTAPKA